MRYTRHYAYTLPNSLRYNYRPESQSKLCTKKYKWYKLGWVSAQRYWCKSKQKSYNHLASAWKFILNHSVTLQCIAIYIQFSSAQSLSRVRLFATPWITARQASLSITNSQSSLRLTSIVSVMPSSHLILCRPLLGTDKYCLIPLVTTYLEE